MKNWWKWMKSANIDREILHNFWTTWGVSMNFSAKMWLLIILKVTRKQGFIFYLEDTTALPPSRFSVKQIQIKKRKKFLLTHVNNILSAFTNKIINFLTLKCWEAIWPHRFVVFRKMYLLNRGCNPVFWWLLILS